MTTLTTKDREQHVGSETTGQRAPWVTPTAIPRVRRRREGARPQGHSLPSCPPGPEPPSQSGVPAEDNPFLLICYNLSSDRPGSPLIISVILRDPGPPICFSKNHSARNSAQAGGNALVLADAGWEKPPSAGTSLVGPGAHTMSHGRFFKRIQGGKRR